MDTKEAYLKKYRAKLAEYNADMDKLNAKLQDMQADAAIEANGLMANLKQKRDAASRKLDEIGTASDEAWGDLKAGAGVLWEDLNDVAKSIRDRFK